VKKFLLVCLAIFVALIAGVVVLAIGAGIFTAHEVERDLVFAKAGATELKLNLAMPKHGGGPFPAVVFLHGGGWRQGSREETRS
jgi:acetyl esterase/lipase